MMEDITKMCFVYVIHTRSVTAALKHAGPQKTNLNFTFTWTQKRKKLHLFTVKIYYYIWSMYFVEMIVKHEVFYEVHWGAPDQEGAKNFG